MRSTSDRAAAAALVVAAALLAVSLAVFRPGYAMYDSVGQYAQVLSGRYDDWHPPVMARVWALLHPVGDGAGPMLAVQLAGYWSGLGLIAAGLARAGRRRASWAVLLVGCWPPFLGWEAVVLKDGQMLAALLLATGIVGFWRLPGRRVPRGAWALAGVALGYAVLVRANAVFAVAPLVAGLVPARTLRRRVAVAAALVAATLLVSPVVNHRLLGAGASGVERTQPLYDLAGIAIRAGPTPGGFDAAETRKLAARGCVRPYFWDPLGDDTRCGGVTQRLRRVAAGRLYLALGEAAALHPVAYAAQRLAHLDSTWRWWVPARWPDAPPPTGSEPNRLGLGEPGAIAGGWQRLAGLAVLTPLGWPIVWIVVGATALAATWRASAVPLARPLLVSALTLEASFAGVSIASDLRYHLWSMMAVAIALVLLARERWSVRASRAGAIVLAFVLVVAIAARVTLPTPPRSYQGMLG